MKGGCRDSGSWKGFFETNENGVSLLFLSLVIRLEIKKCSLEHKTDRARIGMSDFSQLKL